MKRGRDTIRHGAWDMPTTYAHPPALDPSDLAPDHPGTLVDVEREIWLEAHQPCFCCPTYAPCLHCGGASDSDNPLCDICTQRELDR